MKIREIIKHVDENKPNAFSEEQKVKWIAELDGNVAANVMLLNIAEIQQLNYKCPESLDAEPLVAFPHDAIYALWLGAKIDFANGEYDLYANSMEMFNAMLGSFIRWFASTYEPAQGYVRGYKVENV